MVDILRRPELVGLDAFVREDMRFRSPYRDYEGGADASHVLRLVMRVLDDVSPEEDTAIHLRAGDQRSPAVWTRITRLTTSVDRLPMQGVLSEDIDARGKLSEATLFLRPYREVRAAMTAVGQLLDEYPLPSGVIGS